MWKPPIAEFLLDLHFPNVPWRDEHVHQSSELPEGLKLFCKQDWYQMADSLSNAFYFLFLLFSITAAVCQFVTAIPVDTRIVMSLWMLATNSEHHSLMCFEVLSQRNPWRTCIHLFLQGLLFSICVVYLKKQAQMSAAFYFPIKSWTLVTGTGVAQCQYMHTYFFLRIIKCILSNLTQSTCIT